MNYLEILSTNLPNKGVLVKKIITYSILCTNIINIAIANEEAAHAEHHASVFDLKYAVLNFIILFGFLGYKLKKPLSDMFDKEAENIKSLMSSAEKQSKDAEAKLGDFNTKIKNIDSELVKITGEYESDAVNFARNLHEETETAIARMKKDLQSKLLGEKKELVDEMNHEMVSKIIAKTKNQIGTNPEKRTNATKKIMAELH